MIQKMKSVEDRVVLRPHHIALKRTDSTLGPRVYVQLSKTQLGTGLAFRAQLLDFFPDPYQDHDETPD
jgi:hypothetical protein